ncbi:MAG: HNH endonuclease signature motif containing protein [Caldilineaceae bacterium]
MSISPSLRQQIRKEAHYRCGYCQTQERVSGVPLTIEHLIPVAAGGNNTEVNLWLSCRLCNEAKASQINALDMETGATVPLYNPRTQPWQEHFHWDLSKTRLVGLTAIGRATIDALQLNDEFRIASRAIWVEAGWHPPT